MNNRDKWRILDPLDPGPYFQAPRGELLLTVAAAVAWAALLIILIGNWTVPVDKLIGG